MMRSSVAACMLLASTVSCRTRAMVRELRENFKVEWLVAFIVMVGAFVRFWGIDFGLPNTLCRPDEATIVEHAMGMFSGDLNPHFFNYPSLYIYLVSVFYALLFVCGLVFGRYAHAADLLHHFFSDPTTFYLMDRCLSAILGTATILVVYKLTTRVFDRATAIVTIALFSLAYLHVRESHFGVTDAPMTFLVVLSILFIIRLRENRAVRDYILAGLICGLASSTKYNAIFLCLPLLFAHWLNRRAESSPPVDTGRVVVPGNLLITRLQERQLRATLFIGVSLVLAGIIFSPHFFASHVKAIPAQYLPDLRIGRILCLLLGLAFVVLVAIPFFRQFWFEFLDKRLLVAIVSMAAGFLLGTPFVVFDFGGFAAGFLDETVHLQTGHGIDLGIGWTYHLLYTLPLGLGYIMMIAFLCGLMCLVLQEPLKTLLVFSFPVVYYVVAGSGHTVFVRYMTPVTPFICMGAGFFVVYASRTVARRVRRVTLASFFSVVFTCLILAEPGLATLQCDIALSKRDSRLSATVWMQEHLPDGSTVYQTSYWGGVQLLLSRASLLNLEAQRQVMLSNNQGGPAWLVQNQISYLKSVPGKRMISCWYDARENRFVSSEPQGIDIPQFIVRSESPLTRYTGFPDGVASLIDSAFVLRAEFDAFESGSSDGWFDQIDAFFLPFRGFGGVATPGPNISIFERRMTRECARPHGIDVNRSSSIMSMYWFPRSCHRPRMHQ